MKNLTTNVTSDASSPNIVGVELFEVIAVLFICVVGVLGNSLVIMVVYRQSRMRTVTNYFIVNLAIADLFVLIINVPLDLVRKFTGTWLYGAALCKLIPPLQTMATTVSVWSLVAISIGRYIAIVYPFRPQLQIKHAKWFISAAWLIGLIVVIPYMLALELRNGSCSENFEAAGMITEVYTAGVFIAQYIVPLSIIIICYLRVAKELSRSGKGHENSDLIKEQRRETRKVIKLLRVVVSAFAILVLPIHLLYVWIDFFKADMTSSMFSVFSMLSNVMLYSNSASNPILYNFCNDQFRVGFRNYVKPCIRTICLGKAGPAFDNEESYHSKVTTDYNPPFKQKNADINQNNSLQQSPTVLTVVYGAADTKSLSDGSNCSLV